MMLSKEELLRYNRQIILPQLQGEGQEKLKKAKVLVIGAGGLGSPTLFYLAAAGVGRLGLLDFDKVDISNLQRQILYTTKDVGKSKAAIAASRLTELNPNVQFDVHEVSINSGNALQLIAPYDLVIDGSDNLPTRYLVNDACVLSGKPLIYGAIFQFEGQVSVFNELKKDGTRGPNYRDLFPVPPPPEMVPACNEAGVLGVLPGIIGTMQANEAIKVLTGIGTTLSNRLMVFDALDFTTYHLQVEPNLNRPTISELIDYEEFCNPSSARKYNEATVEEVCALLKENENVQLIDVREPSEFEAGNIGGINIPLGLLEEQLNKVDKKKSIVLICKSGARSGKAASKLVEIGYSHVSNLSGGLLRWKVEIDNELRVL